MQKFDSNHKKILSAFISLKNKCIYWEKQTLAFQYRVNKNNLPFVYIGNFYSHIRDICDLSILFVVNEELCNRAARHLCPDLLEELLVDQYLDRTIKMGSTQVLLDVEDFQYSLSDIRDLMSKRINGMVGSQMHDFSISAFSAFEKWITMLYSAFSSEFDKFYQESRRKKLEKAFEAFRTEGDEGARKSILERVMKLQGSYISFPDKMNAIFKKMDPSLSVRSIEQDKRVIEFLRVHRNTIHNGGVHLGKTTILENTGKEFVMENGKPRYSASYSESIALTGELVDIYANIITSIEDIPLEALCIPQEDTQALLILERVVQDTRHAIGPLEERSNRLASFLQEKIGLSERSANKFAVHTFEFSKDLGADDEFDLLRVLSSDLSDA